MPGSGRACTPSARPSRRSGSRYRYAAPRGGERGWVGAGPGTVGWERGRLGVVQLARVRSTSVGTHLGVLSAARVGDLWSWSTPVPTTLSGGSSVCAPNFSPHSSLLGQYLSPGIPGRGGERERRGGMWEFVPGWGEGRTTLPIWASGVVGVSALCWWRRGEHRGGADLGVLVIKGQSEPLGSPWRSGSRPRPRLLPEDNF